MQSPFANLVLHFRDLYDEQSWLMSASLSQVFFQSDYCFMLALFLLPQPFALRLFSGPVVRLSLKRDRDGVRERSRCWLAELMSATVWRDLLLVLPPKRRDFAFETCHSV